MVGTSQPAVRVRSVSPTKLKRIHPRVLNAAEAADWSGGAPSSPSLPTLAKSADRFSSPPPRAASTLPQRIASPATPFVRSSTPNLTSQHEQPEILILPRTPAKVTVRQWGNEGTEQPKRMKPERAKKPKDNGVFNFDDPPPTENRQTRTELLKNRRVLASLEVEKFSINPRKIRAPVFAPAATCALGTTLPYAATPDPEAHSYQCLRHLYKRKTDLAPSPSLSPPPSLQGRVPSPFGRKTDKWAVLTKDGSDCFTSSSCVTQAAMERSLTREAEEGLYSSFSGPSLVFNPEMSKSLKGYYSPQSLRRPNVDDEDRPTWRGPLDPPAPPPTITSQLER